MPQVPLVHTHVPLQLRKHTFICIQMQVCSLDLMPLNASPLTNGPIPSTLARHLSTEQRWFRRHSVPMQMSILLSTCGIAI
jgi:hypothetical protein